MSRFKAFILILFAVGSAEVANAFSLLGKFEDWQVVRIGHNEPGDIGGPMNIGEEYRWNIPLITYGFDESFLNYFGSNGVVAVEQAISILNDLPPASQITPADLSPGSETFPPFVAAENTTAGTLGLLDLKSATLHFLIEEMGLAEPERYVYTLRSRTTTSDPNTTNWVVIQRNFDPVTFEPTPYINDDLYIYTGITTLKNPDEDFPTVEQVSMNPNAGTVASGSVRGIPGFYYPGTNATTALTRDDVGGLHYLFRTNNLNVETLLPDIEEIITNKNNPLLLSNYSLAELTRLSRGTTNDTASEILNRFPGLLVTATNTYFTNFITTNVISFFDNFPYSLGEDLDEPANHVFETTYITNYVQVFDYIFANAITNPTLINNTVIITEYDVVAAENYVPGGNSVRTNIHSIETITEPDQTFYILPPNVLSIDVITNAQLDVVQTTNIIPRYTSALVAVTNTNGVISLTTFDLNKFLRDTINTTNTLQDVLTLYPEALITASNSYLGTLLTTNITSYFTNYPWAPVQVFVTNITAISITNHDYKIANVVMNNEANDNFISYYSEWEHPSRGMIISPELPAYYLEREVLVREFDIVPSDVFGGPGGSNLKTNYHEGYPRIELETATRTNFFDMPDFLMAFGEAFIVPTNLLGYSYLSTVLTITNSQTNTNFFAISDTILYTNTIFEAGGGLKLVETHDLATFSEQARTNDPGTMQGLYPELLIVRSDPDYTPVISNNIVYFFTNAPWCPFDCLILTQQVISVTNVATNWNHIFGNTVTNFGKDYARFGFPPPGVIDSNNVGVLITEENINASWNNAYGFQTTNTTIQTVVSNLPVGNVYIVPTNLFGYDIQDVELLDVVANTNTTVFSNLVLNAFGALEQTNYVSYIRYETNYIFSAYPIEFLNTNDLGATNVFGRRRETVTYSTNTIFEVYPITMLTTNELTTNVFGRHLEMVTYFTNSVRLVNPVQSVSPQVDAALRPGVDKMTFVRVDFDSLTGTNLLYTNSFPLGNTNVLFTNSIIFTNTYVVSNTPVQQLLRRVIRRPDVIFSAGDLGTENTLGIPVRARRTDTTSWINNNAINGQETLAGPGVITPQVNIIFSKVGPFFSHTLQGNEFRDNNEFLSFTHWGSFDSSTNIVIFPEGTTIQDVENEIFNQ